MQPTDGRTGSWIDKWVDKVNAVSNKVCVKTEVVDWYTGVVARQKTHVITDQPNLSINVPIKFVMK